jgi:hypothetical protein
MRLVEVTLQYDKLALICQVAAFVDDIVANQFCPSAAGPDQPCRTDCCLAAPDQPLTLTSDDNFIREINSENVLSAVWGPANAKLAAFKYCAATSPLNHPGRASPFGSPKAHQPTRLRWDIFKDSTGTSSSQSQCCMLLHIIPWNMHHGKCCTLLHVVILLDNWLISRKRQTKQVQASCTGPIQ